VNRKKKGIIKEMTNTIKRIEKIIIISRNQMPRGERPRTLIVVVY
jgi:hypothetical protein